MRRLVIINIVLLAVLFAVAFPNPGSCLDFRSLGSTGEWESYFLYFRLPAGDEEASVLFEYSDAGNFRAARFWKDNVCIEEYRNSVQSILASARIKREESELVLKRAITYISIVIDGETILSVPLSGKLGAYFGLGCDAHEKPNFVRFQPVEEVFFTDSFMRTDNPGEWRIESGFWEICGLSFAERSANPFSLFARFRDSVELGNLEDGRLLEWKTGIGVNMTPDGRIARIAGQAPAGEAGLQQDDVIIEVNGKSIYTMWNRLENAVEGQEFSLKILRANQFFTVDVVARKYRWGVVEKRYTLLPADMDGDARMMTGYPFWHDYTYRASVRPEGEGSVGLIFYSRNESNYYVFRWWGDNTNRKGKTNILELVEVRDGVETVLASTEGGFFIDQYYEMKVAVSGSQITAYIDRIKVFTATSERLSFGMAGIVVTEGFGAYIDDVRVINTDSYAEGYRRRNINDIYRNQSDMRDWSDPVRDWQAKYERNGYTFCYKYECYGPVMIAIHPTAKYKELSLLAYGDSNYREGLTVDFNPSTGGYRVLAGSFEKKGVLPKFDMNATFQYRLSPDIVEICQGNEIIEAIELPIPVKGTKFSVRGVTYIQRRSQDSACVELFEGENTRDYTFEDCPTDWFVMDGKWGVMNKWICDPRWSWLGGINGDGPAAIVSKFDLIGDFSVDLYIASMMMVNDPPFEMLGNYCMTVCSNGRDISSGYTFMMSGDMNNCMRTLRRDQVSRELYREDTSSSYLPADNRRRYLTNEVVHQRWFNGRIVRTGSEIAFYFEGKLFDVISDDQPLDGRRLILWSYQNGWMISRVRIAAEQLTPAKPRFSNERHFSNGSWTDSNSRRSRYSVESDKPSKNLTTFTLDENGSFEIHSNIVQMDLGIEPVLKLTAGIPSTVKADIYFDYLGKTYRVRLTGPENDSPFLPSIGNAVFKADGSLQTCYIPILSMLQDYFDGRLANPVISNIRIGMLSTDEYLLAGFNGNVAGSKFVLGSLEKVAASGKSVKEVTAFENGEAEVVIELAPDSGPVDFSNIRVQLNGELVSDSDSVSLDRTGSRIIVQLRRILNLRDGENVDINVEGMRDFKRTLIAPVNVRCVYSRAKDTTPPRLLTKYIGAKPAVHVDFEYADLSLKRVMNKRLAGSLLADVQRDFTTASSGRASLKISNDSIGGIMRVNLFSGNIDIVSDPIISFDYRMNTDVPLTVLLSSGSRSMFALEFNDKMAFMSDWISFGSGKEAILPARKIGSFAGQRYADGEWHNVFTIIDQKNSVITNINSLAVGDAGFRGAYRYDSINLDNIMITRFIPQLRSHPELLFSECSAIAELYTSITTEPSNPDSKWDPKDGFPSGSRFYFNIRACDESGNWSETVSIPFFCDINPPRLINAVWRDKFLNLYWTEEGEINPNSLKVKCNGKTYTGKNQITWSSTIGCVVQTGKTANKKAVVTIKDSLGNEGIYQIDGSRITRINVTEDL